MPNPKRRHSRQRGRKRRTFYKAKMGDFSVCPQCKKPKLPHRICPHCGYYKGKPIVVIEEKTKKKKK